MKKFLLLACMAAAGGMALAVNTPTDVKFVERMLGLYITPNGQYIANDAGYATIYNVATGESTVYTPIKFGLGNCISNTGIGVGESAILVNGEVKLSEILTQFQVEEISCITPDGTRIAGYAKNPNGAENPTRVPFFADLDEEGNVIAADYLPYPELDLFEAVPQLVTAVYISDDGQTIVGDVVDNYGGFVTPIMYVFENGKWSCSMPVKSIFNPKGVEIIQNPYNNQPPYPTVTNFIENQANKLLYESMYQNYVNGVTSTPPDPADFMTPEEFQAYVDAVTAYNNWYDSIKDLFKTYLDNYYKILEDTPNFTQNEVLCDPQGEYIYCAGGPTDSNGAVDSKIYVFDMDGVAEIIDTKIRNYSLTPTQVLSDGTILASPTTASGPSAYLMLPDSDEFISLADYLYPEHPEIALWIDESFPGGSGIGHMSDDKSVITGAVPVTQLSDDLYENADFRFATYIINFNSADGIESIVAEPEDGVYKVYNLQGLKVIETKEASEVNNLPKGIYIVNGKKVAI